MRYADLFMMVSPEFAPSGENLHLLAGEHASHFFVHWLDLAAPLAIGGLWLWMFFTQLRQRPLLAVGDPYLRESLETRRRPLMAHASSRRPRVSRRRVSQSAAGLRTRAHRRQRLDHRPVRDLAGRVCGHRAHPDVVHVRAVRGRAREQAGRPSSRWRSSRSRGCRRGRGCSRFRRTRSTTSASERARASNGYGWVEQGRRHGAHPDRRGDAADARARPARRGPQRRPAQPATTRRR